MTYYDLKRLALISAVNAEIEGMKSANLDSKILGYSMPYKDDDFDNKATELRNLAYANDEQL